MGGDQATNTLLDVTVKSLEAAGPRRRRRGTRPPCATRCKADYDRQTDVRYAAARGWVDAILDPANTRDALIFALEVATRHAEHEPFQLGVFQV